MPRSRCPNGSRKNKSGTCSRYSPSMGLNRLFSTRCKKGSRKVRYGKSKGTCKTFNKRVATPNRSKSRTPTPKQRTPSPVFIPRRSSRIAAKWQSNGHMRYTQKR